MNRNLLTLVIAVLALGAGGAVVADDYSGNKVQTTTGADSGSANHAKANWFNELDTNKDGKLSKNEVETGDKKGKLTGSWSTIDSNSDGSIDQSEYDNFKATHKDKNHSTHPGADTDNSSTIRGLNEEADQR